MGTSLVLGPFCDRRSDVGGVGNVVGIEINREGKQCEKRQGQKSERWEQVWK